MSVAPIRAVDFESNSERAPVPAPACGKLSRVQSCGSYHANSADCAAMFDINKRICSEPGFSGRLADVGPYRCGTTRVMCKDINKPIAVEPSDARTGSSFDEIPSWVLMAGLVALALFVIVVVIAMMNKRQGKRRGRR